MFAGSATTVSLPSPPKATSAVWSRTLTWSSPSSPKTTSVPPPGVIVSLPEPPRNVSEEPPPISVSLPEPPEAVTENPPTSPTVIASSPPRPLACSVSLEAMSSEKGTRFVRSNLIRAPLGWIVNTSPAVGEPLTSTSSWPSPPFMTSVASPLFQTSVSSPAPPDMVSLPRSPTMRSSPPRPSRTSLPSPPSSRSGPSEPEIESSPTPPSTLSSVSAPTPSAAVTESFPPSPLTWKRSVSVSSVKGTRLVRWNLTPPGSGASVNTSPRLGEPLTSVVSLPAPPSMRSEPSPLFQTRVSFPAPPTIRSVPFAPTRRSLPSPPSRKSLVSAPVRTSSPPSPNSLASAISLFFASTVRESLPSLPLTTTVNVPLAGTVWSPAVSLSQSDALLRPPPVAVCTSRPLDTEKVSVSLAPSRVRVAVVPLIDAELAAALAGSAFMVNAANAAANAASTVAGTRLLLRERYIVFSLVLDEVLGDGYGATDRPVRAHRHLAVAMPTQA